MLRGEAGKKNHVMNVLSLFDGMSCGRIALERAGIPVTNYFASEIDKYAIQVSKANWPDIIQLGDVETIMLHRLPKLDLIIAGSPCQGFSNAGLGMNFEDPRSKLFWNFVYLLQSTKRTNSNILFFLENVKMKKEWADIITEALGVNHIEINAGLLSPTNRKRYYWTNIPNIVQPEPTGMVINDILEHEVSIKYLVSQAGLDREKRRNYSKVKFNPDKMGTINTVNNSSKLCLDGGTCLIQVGFAEGINAHESKTRVYDPSGKCPTLLTHAGGHHHAKIAVNDELWRRLTPLECERVHGLNDNYTKIASERQRYKMIGNGWEIRTITHVFKNIPK